jgi:hypothetical protein
VKALWLALALALSAPPLRAFVAQDVAARLEGRVPANVARAVQGIAQNAHARGLPVEPLIEKAIEGGAKGVPGDRVISAVQLLATRLDEARGALRDAGIPSPTPEALESGADALNAGLNPHQVRDLGRVSRPPQDPALTLRVAATLGALGVPAPQSVRLIEHLINAGRGQSDLLDLPNELQVGMARGVTAAEAAEGLDRGDAVAGQQHPQERRGHHDEEGSHRKP